jgi:hypothetical protein
VKPITAYEKAAGISKPVRKNGVDAPITLLDIDQTVIPMNRNALDLRGVDEML